MKHIVRHSFTTQTDSLLFDVTRYLTKIEQYTDKISTDVHAMNLGSVFNNMLLALSSSICLGSPIDHSFQFLRFAKVIGVLNYKIKSSDGKPVRVGIGGRVIETTGKFDSAYINISFWQTVFYLAMIVRDQQAINFLAGIPSSFMAKGEQKDDEFDHGYFKFLTSLYQNEQNALEWANICIQEAFNPLPVVSPGRKPFVQNTIVPELKLYLAILEEDSQKVEQCLLEALDLRKRYYSNEEIKNDPYGWVAYGLTAACAFAYDRGIKVHVQSDYLPAWMVERKFPDNPIE